MNKIMLLVFISLFIQIHLNCANYSDKDSCLTNNCCFCENQYNSIINKECLQLKEKDVINFCKLFQKMNKEEKYKTNFCGSSGYILPVN